MLEADDITFLGTESLQKFSCPRSPNEAHSVGSESTQIKHKREDGTKLEEGKNTHSSHSHC